MSPHASAASNSIVRFHITTGDTNIGDMDVELFNQDRPETVKNFLLYVRSGGYRQVLLHRLLPGFVLQGGGFTNASNPTNSALFLDYGKVKSFGPLTNEFAVGPHLSNTFATIAMAKVGGDPNSATSEWFFNLGDNSGNLDSQNGGFTVFGRVLPGTNGIAGTNLLGNFNSLSKSNGIIDMTTFFGASWSAFTDLPVYYNGYAAPQNRQLYYATVAELDPPAADTNAPLIAFTFPQTNLTVTNATITLTGTSTDDVAVARVLYYSGAASPGIAAGTTNWSVTLTLPPGTNVVSVQAVDAWGNASPLLQRTITYTEPIPSNSIVRFHITAGPSPIGDVDVELFNRDKPETVRNFLLYVRNGSYSNVLFHRVVTNFIVQGGGYTNADPFTSTNPFSVFGEVKNLGMITNEFGIGPRLSNTLGTISMAKLGNNPNSASAQWFFNLANNTTNLDSQNGGFTVFGRVLTNSGGGLNVLLNTFNSLSKSNGLIDMTTFYGPSWGAFTDLPVDYMGYALPRSDQLFYTTVTELNGPTNADIIPPTVTITSAPPSLVVSNASFTLSGNAADNQGVARVLYYFADTTPLVATGTTNWSATVSLRTGTNYIRVQSVDLSGNLSDIVTQVVTRSISAALTLKIDGPGQVTGVTNGQVLGIGQLYTIEARPDRGALFDGWSGSIPTTTTLKLTFRMQTNTSLTATFKRLPFPKGRGLYRGLFLATNQPAPDTSGTFSVLVRDNRAQAGNIVYRGSNFTFTGLFATNGGTALQGSMFGQNVSMTLRLDITQPPSRIAGVVFAGNGIASLEAYRVNGRLRTNDLAKPGLYTFLTSGGTNAATSPGGDSFGTVRITRAGGVRVEASMADGTTFKQSTVITGSDRFPLFAKLYKNTGSILGWGLFDTNAQAGVFDGNLYWFKPAQATNAYYPGGFTNTLQWQGALYTPPAAGERLLNWTNGTVVLQGGNLQTPLIYHVTLETDDTFTVLTGPTPMTLSVDRQTGRVSGTFFHPVTQADTPLNGMIVLGDVNRGGGIFYGPDQNGSFTISKQ